MVVSKSLHFGNRVQGFPNNVKRWGGTRNFAGGDFFFTGGGGFAQGIFFRSFEAFLMLKLIFHIY